ncbi:hypothetical protein FPZ42_18665 [Mucilaginibacter achroorhodeus]|uniref:Uncharacterized protein n=1 Tax=Mucilaginibacter achroorhodeus TaxID=2599294 RepID=A0A563TX35_9SPHI|nr:hypothetical protein [Mucilaginibacter achroorhodeus]TWR23803.1 hypothetical protein FPZ42_18665 [Mucilaginibacter achroorhodeus]
MENYLATIKQINWLDKEALEAEVLFEIRGEAFWAFSYPCEFSAGETTLVSLSFLEEDISETTFWHENNAQKKVVIRSERDNLRYYCYGRLVGINPVTTDCGVLTFSNGDWINDASVIGQYVYFVISRLDVLKA